MIINKVNDKTTISNLFQDWNETFIWSCLQDCMGVAYTDSLINPTSAQIIVGCFCFFAGEVNQDLTKNKPEDYQSEFIIMVLQNDQWAQEIEHIYKEKAIKRIRYATKKEKGIFDRPKLEKIVSQLPEQYENCLFCG